MDEAVENQQDLRGQWFVIQTLSGHENKVRDTINRQLRTGDQVNVYEALIPENKVKEIRRGKAITVTKKLFPGYVLVRMDLYDADGIVDEKAWYFVRSVQGVLGFLGDATRPSPLTEEEFLDMNPALSEEAAAPVLVIGVKVGDIVRIKDGAFMGYEGNVTAIDETRGRLTVVILIFGRSTPVDLEFWQVEQAV
ncbi:MAG: transcription termination/antitermination factor NusG [Lentisphaeria bacterium]|nr:transcription termination/antitermination factor NusG [Lentisphaerota bacterium]MBR2625728.1 transcription termination/antitermination factor NusG [Lentisphaeria bacterium]